MNTDKKNVLVSGASFAGLCTAYWMNRLGYKVTVVEVGNNLKMGGTPVNIEANTVDIVKRMGIFDQIHSNRLSLERVEFKNEADLTEGTLTIRNEGDLPSEQEFEIERNTLLQILFHIVKDNVQFLFNNSIISMTETTDAVEVTFRDGANHAFDLVFGCDGIHSAVRRIWFGHESEYVHFLGAYFSITIAEQLLIKPNTTQFYNVPDKAVMLNAYKNKTDIVFCFRSDVEIPYDYRNEAQQRSIILEQFNGQRWKTKELLEEMKRSTSFYFDKLCQIRMPSWTKGRVALVGDAGYCASPAAGKGGSLAIDGAAALAEAFENNHGDYEAAFNAYNTSFRTYINEVQAKVEQAGLDILIPRTEEEIRKRNTETPEF